MATIWDADVLIWAASQIVDARDAGLKTSRLMAATPYEILTFVGRGASARDYLASEGGARQAAIDDGRHIHPATRGAAQASLLLDQRMEGARRFPRTAARIGADPARLVLRRRARQCARSHHRPGLFPS